MNDDTPSEDELLPEEEEADEEDEDGLLAEDAEFPSSTLQSRVNISSESPPSIVISPQVSLNSIFMNSSSRALNVSLKEIQ